MKTFINYKIKKEMAGLKIETYLKQALRYSGRKIQKLTRKKGILLNGKPAYLQKKILPDDIVGIRILEDVSYGVEPQQGFLDILYEDAHMVVVNKPPQLLVHPTNQTKSGTLANHLAYEFQQRGETSTVRPLHRLDRNTSGCLIFAKDSHSQHLLEQQLKAGILKRIYQALIKGIIQPPEATIAVPIGSHPSLPNRRAVSDQGEYAATHYRTLEAFAGHTLLELRLDTGRTHQIRVHLSHFGHPVIGDTMYGERSHLIKRQALHAQRITFCHLTDGREITVTAPMPQDLLQAIENLKTRA